MLSAQYLVLGELIDIISSFLISVRMVDVTTGEVIWQKELSESLDSYDYIGAFFADAIAAEIGIDASEDTAGKIRKPVKKDQSAVIELSAGIAAYDEGDTETAKKKFTEVKQIDPESEVASYYLSKLITNSAKFMVITPPFYSYQNPAYLGIMRADRLHLNLSSGLDAVISMATGGNDFVLVSSDLAIREYDGNTSLGYYFPLAENIGIGIELFQSIFRNDLDSDPGSDSGGIFIGRFGQGGMLSFGISPADWFSLGASAALFSLTDYHFIFAPDDDLSDNLDEIAYTLQGGFLFRNEDETFVFDMRGGYCSAYFTGVDPGTLAEIPAVRIPVLIEDTLTLAFNEKQTFVVLKNLNELSFDGGMYYLRLMPAVEQFFGDSFSLRIGAEGAVLLGSGIDIGFGYGFMGGLTFRFIEAGLDIDLNLTHRRQPSRIISGFLYPNTLLQLNASLNDLFLSRE